MGSEINFKKLVSRKLLELQAYSTKSYDHSIKLDAMEMPNDSIVMEGSSILNALKDLELNRYPDPNFQALREELLIAKNLNLPKFDVIVGNGSDELIQLLCMLTANEGQGKLLIPSPTFSVYKILAQIHGLTSFEFNLESGTFHLDISRFIEEILKVDPSLIFIANPNNPTGNRLIGRDIEKVCEACKGLVVLDEAYYKFSGKSHIDMLQDLNNLLIMQTMSKIGFAGIRLGMLFGNKKVIDLLNKIRLPFNVNAISQFVGLEILNSEALIDEKINSTIKERAILIDQLSKIEGIKVYPSEANFILVDFQNYHAELIFSQLLESGVLVKSVVGQHQLLKGCLRVTVGSEAENREFIRIVTRIIAKSHY